MAESRWWLAWAGAVFGTAAVGEWLALRRGRYTLSESLRVWLGMRHPKPLWRRLSATALLIGSWVLAAHLTELRIRQLLRYPDRKESS